MQTKSFQQEQDEALEYFLNTIYGIWKMGPEERKKVQREIPESKQLFLELFLTQECNQNCDYCYLQKNGDKLYPVEYRDKETMLKNMEILLNYYIENNINPIHIDFFSGEIWGYPIGNKAFDILLTACNKGLGVKSICIPSNFSFCRDKKLIEVIDYYIDAFAQKDITLMFSCSMDGEILDKMNRPTSAYDFKTDEYYTNIYEFCKKHKFGYHPMISSNGIEYQKENYDNWIKIHHKYYPDIEEFKAQYPIAMQLEVRDDTWTDDKIMSYLDWLNYVIETDIKEFYDNNHEHFLSDLFWLDRYPNICKRSRCYLPYLITEVDPTPTCTAGKMLCIRCGDLAIAPCHRTSYEKFLFGRYVVENDKIVGVKGQNISLMNAWYRTGNINKPKCDTCSMRKMCLRGCYGAQYEANQDLLYPCETVCNLFKAKLTFLINKYEKVGVFNWPEMKERKANLLHLINMFKESEDYKQWTARIQHLI